MRQMVFWAGAHIFHMAAPPNPGVGFDGSFFWVQAFCALVISVLATGVWSFVDRRRTNYVTLHNGSRLIIRFVLAALMFAYGVFKVIPAQMPYPNLFELVGHSATSCRCKFSGPIWAPRPRMKFCGMRGGTGRHPAARSSHRDAGSADLPCGLDERLRDRHEL